MSNRIAADRWTLDQFVSKAREIRRRLLRWHETLPLSLGMDIEHQGQRGRVVRWDEHTAIGRETFRSRLKAGHGAPQFVLENPYAPELGGPIERDGQFSSDQTEYVLRDFWEHLAGDPTLEILRAAFCAVLDSQAFSVQPLGVPEGQTIGPEDVEVGKTPWIVKGTRVDRQILDEFVEAAENLAAGPRDQPGEGFPSDPQTARKVKSKTKLATAMMLVQEHPEWSDRYIAEKAGYKGRAPHTSLSRSKVYKAAAALARGKKEDLPHGTKDRETGGVEAWENSDEQD